MDNPIIYAISHPVQYDPRSRRMFKMNLDMAERHGHLHVVFPGDERPPPIDECGEELKAVMSNFRSCDKLLLVGDMDLIAFAAVIAAKTTGGPLTLLKWDKRDRRYYEVKAPKGLL